MTFKQIDKKETEQPEREEKIYFEVLKSRHNRHGSSVKVPFNGNTGSLFLNAESKSSYTMFEEKNSESKSKKNDSTINFFKGEY